MKNGEKQKIKFFCDKNKALTSDFMFLDDNEIAELIERRLSSSEYYGYSICSVHKTNGTITLMHDACGDIILTTLAEIEEGQLPQYCQECKKQKEEKYYNIKRRLQPELVKRGLVVGLNADCGEMSLCVHCTKCGNKYYMDDENKSNDFAENDEANDMYCKNWDCMIDALADEKHWFGRGVKSGSVKISNLCYNKDDFAFVCDSEDWFDSLKDHQGIYECKCNNCNARRVSYFGDWSCEACSYRSYESYEFNKWDNFKDEIIIRCKECQNQYSITKEEADAEIFDCFVCYKKNYTENRICPVCENELSVRAQYRCNSCGFPIYTNGPMAIQSQEDFFEWMKKTVLPCKKILYHKNKNGRY